MPADPNSRAAEGKDLSKRSRLVWKWAILGGVPVAVAAGIFFMKSRTGEDAYVAGSQEEGITRNLDRETDADLSGIRFTEVTEDAGIDFQHFPFQRTSQLPEDMGSGAAWGDYDDDGLPDLFLVNFAAPVGVPDKEMATSTATDRLYRNLGDGTFEDVTAVAGVGKAHRGMGAYWADYDNDGDLDLFVTTWGENVLWQNQGDGTFRDVAARARLDGFGFWTGAAWADFDLDGDLDLYVSNYVAYRPEEPGSFATTTGEADFPFTLNPSSYPPEPNRFYVNQGNGTFVERAEAAGVAGERGRSLSVDWVDLDEDGYPDLYVANDVSDNVFYRNRGDGTFEDLSYPALIADYRGSMGIAVGDWDGDTDLDMFITHWIAQENALYTSQLNELSAGDTESELFFGDDAVDAGLGQISLNLIGWGTAFFDADSDGLLDLVTANGSTFQERDDPTLLRPMNPHLYWNRGATEGFFEIGEEAGLRTDPPGSGRGVALADYDRDGDIDVVIVRYGGRTRLLRNDSRGGNKIAFRLEGRRGHSSGLGARVAVYAGDRTMVREVGAGAPYLSQSDTEVLVGLGTADRADSVSVTWPGGGHDMFLDLESGRLWHLEEGAEARMVQEMRGADNEIATAAAGRRTSGISEHAVIADLSTELTRDEQQRFWALAGQADGLFNAGRWSDAAEAFTQMLELDPSHGDARYNLGNMFLELGRYAEALAAWERLLVENPRSSRAWVQLGVLHTMPEAGFFDLAAAADAFQSAHDINREDSRPSTLLGEVALARGDLDGAWEHLGAAYRMNGQAISALYLSGYVAWKRGREDRAADLLTETLRALEGPVVIAGMTNEGDTRSERMAEATRRAARRRLFAECVEALGDVVEPADPDEVYSCVDRALRRLPGTR